MRFITFPMILALQDTIKLIAIRNLKVQLQRFKVTMIDDSFPARMEVRQPRVIQLYSANTPNGIKVAACLEEILQLRRDKGDFFDYEPHTVNLLKQESRLKSFTEHLNPNSKIPVIVDHNPDGSSMPVFESGAILLHLAERYHELIPVDPKLRCETIQWLFWGSSSFSTQLKHFGFYYKYCHHKLQYCVDRYAKETHRLLGVLERQLSKHGKHWVVGDYFTIADVAIWPWIYALHENYDDARQNVFGDFKDYPHLKQWYNRCLNRPASQRSLDVTRLF